MDTYFVIAKNKSISVVAKTINKLHIQKNMHFNYKKDYYEDKLNNIDNLFIEYLVPIMVNIDHPSLIE